MPVKSNYNFVPAPNESEVYLPDWDNQVSHDIPFSDGESGEIEIKITAETPIFIRNGHSKKDKKTFEEYLDKKRLTPAFLPDIKMQTVIDRYLSFSNVDGRYFIPATSLKGMFRNVLEIMTNSNLNKELVNDDRYAFRDLTSNSLYLQSYDTSEVYCGWLKEDENGSWKISEAGKPEKISHEEIDHALKTNFKSLFSTEIYNNFNNLEVTGTEIEFTVDGNRYSKNKRDYALSQDWQTVSKKLSPKYKNASGKYSILGNPYTSINSGNFNGILVVTGQPMLKDYSKADGKFHEFIFPNNDIIQEITISKNEQKDFKFIYFDNDNQRRSPDWTFWRDKLRNGKGSPVFFNKKDDGTLKHFGLAYMYKLPFLRSVHQMQPLIKQKVGKDMAQLIFGFTDKKEDSLKGRVFFSHAFAQNSCNVLSTKQEILSSPKASYYPFYVKQFKNPKKEYNTYMDEATIRGFKRYPVHQNEINAPIEERYEQSQLNNPVVFSYFNPLDKNTQFKQVIRFHNLKKVEIGALLSAITFHLHNNNCFHSLGAAKPYGYGKIKIDNLRLRYLQYTFDEYLLEFEEKMGNDWANSDKLKSLIGMASNKNDTELVYPKIPEFRDYKNNKEKLDDFPIENVKFISMKEKSERKRQIIDKGIELRSDTVKNLVKDVNGIIELLGELPENYIEVIESNIRSIYKAHRESRTRLQKPFNEEHVWRKEIAQWFGEAKAKALYDDLNNSANG